MANLSWILLLFISACQVVRSDGSARERWEKPDGKNPDNFKETYYLGDKIKIQWKGWNTTESKKFVDKNNDEPMAKLYVNAWNPNYSTWYDNLAINLNIGSGDSHEWTVAVPPDDLRKTKQYAFTFIPNEQKDFSVTGIHISSPGFEIKSRPSTSSSTPTASSSTTSSTSANSEASSADSSNTSPSTSGLSTGAKAGIGVGVSIGGLAVLAALAFFFLRSRNRASSQDIGATEAALGVSQQEAKPATHELSVTPAELAGTPDRR
ncbi:hypothetical protein N7541_003246 [Penicillium brevicompactum]|uniref:Uncharacterized protein n=1 Tax=Penicillium brevicompactum TaxID=5074 RepID=A0A9W9RLL6_PENBR|nr:hypothetical protein N7541_003246 [Penicillium brevicompactum]